MRTPARINIIECEVFDHFTVVAGYQSKKRRIRARVFGIVLYKMTILYKYSDKNQFQIFKKTPF